MRHCVWSCQTQWRWTAVIGSCLNQRSSWWWGDHVDDQRLEPCIAKCAIYSGPARHYGAKQLLLYHALGKQKEVNYGKRKVWYQINALQCWPSDQRGGDQQRQVVWLPQTPQTPQRRESRISLPWDSSSFRSWVLKKWGHTRYKNSPFFALEEYVFSFQLKQLNV